MGHQSRFAAIRWAMDGAYDAILARFSGASGMQFPNHDCSRCFQGTKYLAEVALDILSFAASGDRAGGRRIQGIKWVRLRFSSGNYREW